MAQNNNIISLTVTNEQRNKSDAIFGKLKNEGSKSDDGLSNETVIVHSPIIIKLQIAVAFKKYKSEKCLSA